MSECAWCSWPNRQPAIVRMWGRVEVCRDCAISKGGLLGRRRVAIHDLGGDFSPANLKKLAAAGIMDANALFLPAGKLSLAEAKKRECANVLPVHPD